MRRGPGKEGNPELVHYSDKSSTEDYPLSWDELALLELMGVTKGAAGQQRRKIPPHLIASISGQIQSLLGFAQNLDQDPKHVLTQQERLAPLATNFGHRSAMDNRSKPPEVKNCYRFADDMQNVLLPPGCQRAGHCSGDNVTIVNDNVTRVDDNVKIVDRKFTVPLNAPDLGPLQRFGKSASLRGNPWTLESPPLHDGMRITKGTHCALLCLMNASDARRGNSDIPWRADTFKTVPVQVSIGGPEFEITQLPHLGALPKIERGARNLENGYPPKLLQADWAARNVPPDVLTPSMRVTQEGDMLCFKTEAEPNEGKAPKADMWDICCASNATVRVSLKLELQPGGVNVITVQLTADTATPPRSSATSGKKPVSTRAQPQQKLSTSQPGNTGNALAALQVFFLVLHHVRCNTRCHCFWICSRTTVVSKTSMLRAIMMLHVWPEEVNEWLRSNVPTQTSVKSALASFVSASQAGGGNMQNNDESVLLWQELSSCVIGARNVLDVLCFLLLRIANREASSPGYGAFTDLKGVIAALENARLSDANGHRENKNHDCALGVTFPTPDEKTNSANLLISFERMLKNPDFDQHIKGMMQPGMA